jgi:hypothetical protein
MIWCSILCLIDVSSASIWFVDDAPKIKFSVCSILIFIIFIITESHWDAILSMVNLVIAGSQSTLKRSWFTCWYNVCPSYETSGITVYYNYNCHYFLFYLIIIILDNLFVITLYSRKLHWLGCFRGKTGVCIAWGGFWLMIRLSS